MHNSLVTVPLSSMIDKRIGKRGTEKREAFESALKTELSNHKLNPHSKTPNSKKSVNLDN